MATYNNTASLLRSPHFTPLRWQNCYNKTPLQTARLFGPWPAVEEALSPANIWLCQNKNSVEKKAQRRRTTKRKPEKRNSTGATLATGLAAAGGSGKVEDVQITLLFTRQKVSGETDDSKLKLPNTSPFDASTSFHHLACPHGPHARVLGQAPCGVGI